MTGQLGRAKTFDLVVRGGRLLDPSSGLDARLDFGVRFGRIVALEPDLSAAHDARRRGILFDVGRGVGSFSYRVVEAAIAKNFWPDTISTDLHSLSAAGPVYDLPTTMATFLDLGLPIEEVVARVTSRPAAALQREVMLGGIGIGRPADLAVFDVEPRERRYRDTEGAERPGSVATRVHQTIRAGIPWFSPMPHPGRGVSAPA